MMQLLEAQNVTRVFGSGLLNKSRTVAVDEVSLAIHEERPTIIAVAGESGSGKTTLARLLLGMIQPTSGSIRFKGRDLSTIDRHGRKEFRRQVQAIFQDPFEVYNPFYKVDQVLTTPVHKFRLAASKAEAQQRIEESLQMAGLRPDETLGRYPHQLSGGQRQRIMVARALLLNPKIILADEPVSMVDASLRATILESLVKLKRELGISLVYITHDLTTAYQISENIFILYRGSVAEVGSVERVIKDPQHPYTRLLVSSIPLPDPDIRWGRETDIETKAAVTGASRAEVQGCKFSNRCPFVMAECRRQAPPLYQTNEDRAVACFLYKEGAQVSGKEMAESLAV
ncbi:MAG: ABC transporter ATP-binding protein [Thermomicrobiales bacterium]|nr:ABC transporter ATP-binding protein [Thermomicrobiales bacterium]